jgi:hypothetical protein
MTGRFIIKKTVLGQEALPYEVREALQSAPGAVAVKTIEEPSSPILPVAFPNGTYSWGGCHRSCWPANPRCHVSHLSWTAWVTMSATTAAGIRLHLTLIEISSTLTLTISPSERLIAPISGNTRMPQRR